MQFTVDINVSKEPEKAERYWEAFYNKQPLDTGSKVIEASIYYLDTEVHNIFKIRS